MDATRLSYLSQLYDLYHPLLTDKKRSIADATFTRDLSLSEIAEALKISRSAVQDHLQKSIAKLEELEASLGFLALLNQQESLLNALEKTSLSDAQKALIKQLKEVI